MPSDGLPSGLTGDLCVEPGQRLQAAIAFAVEPTAVTDEMSRKVAEAAMGSTEVAQRRGWV